MEVRVVEGEIETSKLLAMRSGEAASGITTTSWSMCRITTCAGVTPLTSGELAQHGSRRSVVLTGPGIVVHLMCPPPVGPGL